MPGKDKLGDKVGIVTGNGHGAERRIWTGAAECYPTHGQEKLRSQVEEDAKTTQPVASVMPVGS